MSSFKILEINIISAQDLSPVSKLLRTYAVAWLHPDHKLTTGIDHHGNTNPTWNYRLVFPLDDNHLFLSSSSTTTLTVEIYNVSWLRDIPIGSVHSPIASILPPQTDSTKTRFVSLRIRRPSGTLQGTLNLGVSVVDNSSMPLDRQLSAPTGGDTITHPMVNRSPHEYSKRNHENLEEEEEKKNAKIKKLRRSQSERTDDEECLSKSSSIFTAFIYKFSNYPKKSKATTAAAASISSYVMRPLPSEVAASMAKGLYSTSSSGELGSSVFENWTVINDGREEAAKPKAVRWKTDELTSSSSKKKQRSGSGGRGLLSCFGILCGYECNIVCGASKSKKKRRRFGERKVHVNQSVETLDVSYYR